MSCRLLVMQSQMKIQLSFYLPELFSMLVTAFESNPIFSKDGDCDREIDE